MTRPIPDRCGVATPISVLALPGRRMLAYCLLCYWMPLPAPTASLAALADAGRRHLRSQHQVCGSARAAGEACTGTCITCAGLGWTR